jgi:hypothetical protein
VGGLRHAPAALPQGKRLVTHFIGGWLGSRAGPNLSGKPLPPQGSHKYVKRLKLFIYLFIYYLIPFGSLSTSVRHSLTQVPDKNHSFAAAIILY